MVEKFIAERSASDFHNSLEDFCNIKSSVERNNYNIIRAGDILLAHRCENIIGICVLHKHFHLLPDEILVRSRHDKCFLSIPRKFDAADRYRPVSWAFDLDSSQIFGIEYARFDGNDEDYPSTVVVESIMECLKQSDLAAFFGLVYMPWYEMSAEAFEYSDPALRASLVISRDQLRYPVRTEEFAQSVFAFEKRDGILAVTEKSKCPVYCLNCQPSTLLSPEICASEQSLDSIYDHMIRIANNFDPDAAP
ncbi:hypothetical protein [Mesorhizobium sp. 113-1-2]|uniref:hypothetical protein n=1 Tax=Mesorhizobium sp. 113-1-2 TaxID=2744515 RepID=UPI0019276797|nr:hypothetical protein [Mesorhizobium sp. 113-1-2]